MASANHEGPESVLDRLEMVHAASTDDRLRREWFTTARQHFGEISNVEGWLHLEADIIRELLNDDEELRDVSEIEIYRAVLKWLDKNRDQLPSQVDRLLSVVRFSAMSTTEKFQCLNEAKRADLQMFVKPYMIEADWFRTCMELNHPEFTDLIEFDRSNQFVGEGRRARAIEMEKHELKRRRARSAVVTVDTKPMSIERVENGNVDLGTVVPRPRPDRCWSLDRRLDKTRVSQYGEPERPRLPSQYLQFWRNEMVALAETSNDEDKHGEPLKTLPVPISSRSDRSRRSQRSSSSGRSSRGQSSGRMSRSSKRNTRSV